MKKPIHSVSDNNCPSKKIARSAAKIGSTHANIDDLELNKAIDHITNNCNVCDRYKKARSRPVVCFQLGQDVNDVLALDLKFYEEHIILHMICAFSRYSQAIVIRNKNAETVADAILKHWIAIFGSPNELFADNGGEFNNDLLRDVAEFLNVSIHTTAAYSPWSNGIVERHNAILADIISKVMSDQKCNIDIALAWALNAKNSLHNSSGFSPNQLVFGRNPNLPSILNNKLPALRNISAVIADHLNALHNSRKAFIESESSSKLKRALNRKTRPANNRDFFMGDTVLFKRPDREEWHGPVKIVGIDGKVVFVRHGGKIISVSPCNLRHETEEIAENLIGMNIDDFFEDENENKPITELDIPENVTEVEEETEVPELGENVTEVEEETEVPELKISLPDSNPILESSPDINDSNMTPPNPDLPSKDIEISEINLPKVKQRIFIFSPDENQFKEYFTISRAGKVGKQN